MIIIKKIKLVCNVKYYLFSCFSIESSIHNNLWSETRAHAHETQPKGFATLNLLAVSHGREGVRRRGLFSFFLSSPPFLLPSSSLPLSFPSFFFSLFLFIAPQGSYTVYIPKIQNLEGLYKKKEVKWEDLTN